MLACEDDECRLVCDYPVWRVQLTFLVKDMTRFTQVPPRVRSSPDPDPDPTVPEDPWTGPYVDQDFLVSIDKDAETGPRRVY